MIIRFLLKIILELSTVFTTSYANFFIENSLISYAKRLKQARENKPAKLVAIFGSSFNPTTLGHIDFIRMLLAPQSGPITSVCVIPAGQSPLKDPQDYASVADRLQILKLVLKAQLTAIEQVNIRIDLIEMQRNTPSWMIVTISALIIQNRARESYILACGYDHLPLMRQWYRWTEFANLCTLYFYPRQGVDIVSLTAADTCLALCRAKIAITIWFVDPVIQQRFSTLCQENCDAEEWSVLASYLHLKHWSGCTVRASSASEIRDFYHHSGSRPAQIPAGLSPEAHEYIVTHHCYTLFK